jgi:hypothetical protein
MKVTPGESTALLSMRECLKCAKMLVPKFACQEVSGWHIQWPKDDPHVVHAPTKDELVLALAARMQQLGRAGNEGRHVRPENSCPTC